MSLAGFIGKTRLHKKINKKMLTNAVRENRKLGRLSRTAIGSKWSDSKIIGKQAQKKGENRDKKIQKFNSLLKNRPGGVAGPKCTIDYEKS